jgi:cysteine desulfurase/selenocysteine lyase
LSASETAYRCDFPALNPPQGLSQVPPQGSALRGGAAFPLYLDNAATTQKPLTVLQAIEGFYRDFNANPYRGLYHLSRQATQVYEGCRAVVADFVGVDPTEIVFTRNATEALNLTAYSWGLANLKPGDQIALLISEHHSNLVPWQFVGTQTGAELIYLYPTKRGQLSTREIDAKVGPRTRIVACAQVSNVLGSINPIEALTRRAHEQGALVVCDCAQSVAHMPLDLRQLDVDFAAFSGHKMYGPMGIGILFAKAELLANMQPFLYGGEMIDQVWDTHTVYREGPRRFEAGTPNVAGAFGLTAAIDYLRQVGFENIQRIEREHTAQLLAGLAALPDVKVIGDPEPSENRCGVVSFTLNGIAPDRVAYNLDAAGIAIRSGSHCAQPLHRALLLEASCRVSPCFYNTGEEIERFLSALAAVKEHENRHIMSSSP